MTPVVLLKLGRVSNLPTVWTNILAGAVVGGAGIDARSLFLLMVSASLFYVGGMYLNDAFDREIDARERPERPIPSGEIAASTVFGAGFGMLAGGAGVALMAAQTRAVNAGPVVAAAAALAAAIVLYNLAHKGVALAPIVMGSCRALVYLLAAAATGGTIGQAVVIPAFALLCYVAGLTYAASQENLRNVKNLWPLLLLSVPAGAAIVAGGPAWVLLPLLGGFALWVSAAVALISREGPKDVRGAVTRLIAGISLVDAIAIAAVGSAAPAAIAAGGLLLTHLLQRRVPGT